MLPDQMIYALRVLVEHGDAGAQAAYAKKGGMYAGWRAGGGARPPQIGDLDFREIVTVVDQIEAELNALWMTMGAGDE
jgi:hypothetical protein